ncbi:hypothetical protein HF086_007892 [Spodoptera exigua]|uniref:Uncharacterized protein n=1 Tax=Spodoptera exigua TaxID=7107 RepID=A0A922MXS6_SPOEX|nr:hypothetical protein HF086_007892 [Spodoptera exigua]
MRGIKREITHLHLMNWPGECFNVARLQYHYPELVFLEFINATSLKSFKGHFSAVNKIEKLVIHGLMSLWELPPEIVMDMPVLKELDLRGNMLRHIKSSLLTGPRSLEDVYLAGNSWDCSDGGLDWLAMEAENGTIRRKIKDYDELVCHQQLYRGKPLNKVMDIIRFQYPILDFVPLVRYL